MWKAANAAEQMLLPLESTRQVYRVSELHEAVQRLFTADFRSIWVAGEVSNCRQASSGHYYFSLKDEEGQLKCALFKNTSRYVRFKPRDGLAVLARGNLEVYEARGEYQLIVEALEPQGAGALQLAFEELKKKLAAEGLFAAERKRQLPRFPRRIAVVTSPTGAVIQDILHVLERRFQGLHVRLFPAQVQGEGAVEQICQGIRYFNQSGWGDVIIVARGGGSLEDLWSFNEEAVARTIAASSIPVISAVGHETDFTIADFVADHRAPTPSAAAEIVVCTRDSIFEQIAVLRNKLLQAMRYKLLMCRRELQERDAERTLALIGRALSRRAQRIDDLEYRLRNLAYSSLESGRRRLTTLASRLAASDLRVRFAHCRRQQELFAQRLTSAVQQRLWGAQRREEALRLRLEQLSPLAVLARGYAIVQDRHGRALRSASAVSAGDPLRIRLHEGSLQAIVSETTAEAAGSKE